jgi:hypothetical protein
MIERGGQCGGFELKAHPDMPRHARECRKCRK